MTSGTLGHLWVDLTEDTIVASAADTYDVGAFSVYSVFSNIVSCTSR